jgi:molybdopterin molybdotransferase
LNGKLLSVKDALTQILADIQPLDIEQVALDNALMRVLAQPIFAPFDLPPFDNSSMDGFAVYANDIKEASTENPILLRVVADIPAGEATHDAIYAGQAARIMTGAVLPQFADAVIPVEDTDFNGRPPGTDAPEYVQVFKAVNAGDYIRPKGQDARAGNIMLEPNRYLKAQELGFLAMLGISHVNIFRRPRIALLSTGDELLEVGAPLEPGKIYDANTFTLMSLIRTYGGDPIMLGISADNEGEVSEKLEVAQRMGVDMILSSAGVSVGAFDFVRSVVERNGHLTFWRVNMRPGKPIAFGAYKNTPFIGLPGNPVSAFVGFEVFVRPAINKMAGLKDPERVTFNVILSEPVESDGRESYLRAIIYEKNGKLMARLTGHQGSGNLRSLVQANALLIVPSEVKFVPIGSRLDAWMIGDIISDIYSNE